MGLKLIFTKEVTTIQTFFSWKSPEKSTLIFVQGFLVTSQGHHFTFGSFVLSSIACPILLKILFNIKINEQAGRFSLLVSAFMEINP